MNNVEPQSAAGSAAVPEESKNELSMRLNIIERDKLVSHFNRYKIWYHLFKISTNCSNLFIWKTKRKSKPSESGLFIFKTVLVFWKNVNGPGSKQNCLQHSRQTCFRSMRRKQCHLDSCRRLLYRLSTIYQIILTS